MPKLAERKDCTKSNVGYKDRQTCCGCGACAEVCPKSCIRMESDAEGFYYPVVDETLCIECGACLKACPWLTNVKRYPLQVYALKAKDETIRYKSSSGGAFEVLASAMLMNGYVVYGASYSEDFSKVSHIRVEKPCDLHLLRGSKYVQSSLSGIFFKISSDLKSGIQVLFSGTGCQVASLKAYLKRDYENLLTVDILCHGVPSPLLYRQYIEAISRRYGKIRAVNMKDKTDGWGRQRLKIDAEKRIPEAIQGLWYKVFYSRVALRPSCYECIFMDMARVGDITLGDYWGIEKIDNTFFDKNGVSLLLANTEKGLSRFESVKGLFDSLKTSPGQCVQPVLSGPVEAPEWRSAFWETYFRLGFKETLYHFWGVQLNGRFMGAVKRIMRRLAGK